jgi:ATP-dependent RNA helicase DDX41
MVRRDPTNYLLNTSVHRIGRTGRNGKTGVATTFINKNNSESILRDLKQLLIESKQRLPAILETLGGDASEGACVFCGGLGHKSTDCPKMLRNATGKQTDEKGVTGAGDW